MNIVKGTDMNNIYINLCVDKKCEKLYQDHFSFDYDWSLASQGRIKVGILFILNYWLLWFLVGRTIKELTVIDWKSLYHFADLRPLP